MRIVKKKRGQFIIIAALLMATMMISVGTIMYGAVTYYRHERWEEYLAIIDNVRIGSNRVVEISLANYTSTIDGDVLQSNLFRWQNDVKKAYAGFGVILMYSLAEDQHDAYGLEISYEKGLALDWFKEEAFSSANATFYVNMTSVGLSGYTFSSPKFLRIKILETIWDNQDEKLTISLKVDKEDSTPITNLEKSSFSVLIDDVEPDDFTLSRFYSEAYNAFIYEIECDAQPPQPSLVSMTTVDIRGIKVVANSTVSAS